MSLMTWLGSCTRGLRRSPFGLFGSLEGRIFWVHYPCLKGLMHSRKYLDGVWGPQAKYLTGYTKRINTPTLLHNCTTNMETDTNPISALCNFNKSLILVQVHGMPSRNTHKSFLPPHRASTFFTRTENSILGRSMSRRASVEWSPH